MHTFPTVFSPSDFPIEILCPFLCYRPCSPHPPWFYCPNIFSKVQIMKFCIMQFSPPTFGPNVLSTLLSCIHILPFYRILNQQVTSQCLWNLIFTFFIWVRKTMILKWMLTNSNNGGTKRSLFWISHSTNIIKDVIVFVLLGLLQFETTYFTEMCRNSEQTRVCIYSYELSVYPLGLWMCSTKFTSFLKKMCQLKF